MSKKTIYKVYYEYEFMDETITNYYLIDADDLEGAIALFNTCYKEDDETLINIEEQSQYEKDALAKVYEERKEYWKKYHERKLHTHQPVNKCE